MSLGLLFSALGLVVLTQAMIINKPQEFKQHEVVYPQKLHVVQKREIQENLTEPNGKEEEYESEVQYQIILNGENMIFQLHQNNDLLSPDYTETYYLPDGKKITTSPQMTKHCYYQGHILNEEDSVASLNLCGGLRGFFKHQNQRYLIEPLKDGDQQAHAVLKYEDLDPANQTCGIENSDQKYILTRNIRAVSSPKNLLTSPKYISLLLVVDKAFHNKYNGNQTLIRNFLFEVINLLNVIYNTLDVHVALVGIEVWSDTNKIKVEPNIGTTYTAFLNWHRSWKGRKHNHAQLLSGIAFNNKRVGFTAQNSMCDPNSVAVIEASRKNSVSLVGVMSHELGHVLGMSDVKHSTRCPSGSCVMNEYLTSKFPKDFNAGSRKEFHKYLSSRKPMCLLQAPTPEDIITNPVCGNKLQEVGEDCDCGKSKECTNSCCDARTCKWKPGVPCERDEAVSARSNSSGAFSQILSNGRSRSLPEYFLNILLGPVSCFLLLRYGQV